MQHVHLILTCIGEVLRRPTPGEYSNDRDNKAHNHKCCQRIPGDPKSVRNLENLPIKCQKTRFHRVNRTEEKKNIGNVKLHITDGFNLGRWPVAESFAVENGVVFDRNINLEYDNDCYKENERKGVEPVVPLELAIFAPVNNEAAHSKQASYCGHDTCYDLGSY